MLRIGNPFRERHGDLLVVTFPVTIDGEAMPLWYELPVAFEELLAETADAAAVAMLLPAMLGGRDLIVEGTLSERLFHNLSGAAQHVFHGLLPATRLVRVEAGTVTASRQRAAGVASGFSAGVDSFAVLQDYFTTPISPGYRLTHLLFNNVGSHGRLRPLDNFRQRADRVGALAARLELPLVVVNSNVDDFFPAWVNFQQTHSPRNVSVALLLQGGIGRWLYASTYRYAQQRVAPTYDAAYADMLTLPLLSTECLDALSVGSEYSRVDKTMLVAGNPHAVEFLDVCALEGERNCSCCWKCLRTLLTLEIAGLLPRFGKVFDLRVYGRHRGAYMSKVLHSRDPLLVEIVELARARGFRFPLVPRLLPPVAYLPSKAVRRLWASLTPRLQKA